MPNGKHRKWEEERDRLLEAALPHVAFDGWGVAALRAGARDIGLDPSFAEQAFPGGARDMIALHSRLADRRMLEALAHRDLASLRIRDRIAAAVRLRLEQAGDHREAIRRALSVLALPGNSLLAVRLLYETVDAIWRAAGDRSTDWNFYSKRGLLAAVYGSTLLYWLDDRSPGCAESWAFLDRRIAEVMQIPRLTSRLGRLFDRFPDPVRVVRLCAKRGTTGLRSRRSEPAPAPGSGRTGPAAP